ncbi:MAG: substrate-binding domain-containing protein [Oscillospiraceae bacterium]|nr:substrate-binding domain-containing protein [Oscillospiraceae bacterium]
MKKIIALLLVLVLAVSLVACAGGKSDKKTIAVIAKGETHAFWQAVKAGAVAAGKEAGYEVTFQGPTSESESEVPNQRNMVEAALNDPSVKAIVLATIGTGFVDQLVAAYDKGLPVVEFDSGLYSNGADITAGKDPTIGSVATDNKKAGGVVAENFYAYLKAQNVLVNGYKVGVIQHDATSTGIDRAEGFIEKIQELAKADNITLEINRQEKQNNAGEYKLGLTALTEWGAQAIFMTNEGVVNEVYPEVKDNAPTYKDILFCGFDAGTNQYDWIKDNGKTCALLVGSVAQDSYSIGYQAVKLAIAKLNNEKVSDVGIGGQWYTTENIDALKDQNIFYMG